MSSRFNTTVYACPVVNVTGNGLVELVDPDDEYNVLAVLDVDEGEVFLWDLNAKLDTARAKRRQSIADRRDNPDG